MQFEEYDIDDSILQEEELSLSKLHSDLENLQALFLEYSYTIESQGEDIKTVETNIESIQQQYDR